MGFVPDNTAIDGNVGAGKRRGDARTTSPITRTERRSTTLRWPVAGNSWPVASHEKPGASTWIIIVGYNGFRLRIETWSGQNPGQQSRASAIDESATLPALRAPVRLSSRPKPSQREDLSRSLLGERATCLRGERCCRACIQTFPTAGSSSDAERLVSARPMRPTSCSQTTTRSTMRRTGFPTRRPRTSTEDDRHRPDRRGREAKAKPA